uniref:Uncharacterized protein n=1 Tax=Vitis vinifera TaxID=29760 RepID=F6HZY5_VITVI
MIFVDLFSLSTSFSVIVQRILSCQMKEF